MRNYFILEKNITEEGRKLINDKDANRESQGTESGSD